VACGCDSLADIVGCQPWFSGIAGKPFAKKVIQSCMFGLGPAAGTLNEGFIGAESHISHPPVYTKRAHGYPSSLIAASICGRLKSGGAIWFVAKDGAFRYRIFPAKPESSFE